MKWYTIHKPITLQHISVVQLFRHRYFLIDDYNMFVTLQIWKTSSLSRLIELTLTYNQSTNDVVYLLPSSNNNEYLAVTWTFRIYDMW